MPAHLIVFQHPRNPTEHDRAILELIAAGHSHTSAAAELHTRTRNVTQALAKMRARYTAPTNESLIALAVRFQWIALEIDCAERGTGHLADSNVRCPQRCGF